MGGRERGESVSPYLLKVTESQALGRRIFSVKEKVLAFVGDLRVLYVLYICHSPLIRYDLLARERKKKERV